MYRYVIVCACFLSLVCLGFACIFAHVLSFAGEMTAIRKELVAEKVEKLPMLGTWFYLDITDIQLLCHFPHDNSHMDALFFSEKPVTDPEKHEKSICLLNCCLFLLVCPSPPAP